MFLTNFLGVFPKEETKDYLNKMLILYLVFKSKCEQRPKKPKIHICIIWPSSPSVLDKFNRCKPYSKIMRTAVDP